MTFLQNATSDSWHHIHGEDSFPPDVLYDVFDLMSERCKGICQRDSATFASLESKTDDRGPAVKIYSSRSIHGGEYLVAVLYRDESEVTVASGRYKGNSVGIWKMIADLGELFSATESSWENPNEAAKAYIKILVK